MVVCQGVMMSWDDDGGKVTGCQVCQGVVQGSCNDSLTVHECDE